MSNVQSRDAVGKAGNIDITTGSLSLTNGAQINSFTSGQGNAGNITIQAVDAVSFDGITSNRTPSASFSSVRPGAVGNGGSINITASNLFLTNGGNLGVGVEGTSDKLPAGQGDGGIININLRDKLIVSGADSGIASGLGSETLGRSGNIKIESEKVEVIDGGSITSSSRGKGTAGNIDIRANSVRLNKGQITAQTSSSDGGNINLNLSEYLLLRNNSQISTNAGTEQQGGDGGNIDIDSGFIVAVLTENSDITANAFSGKGGNVNIRAQGIFGIEPRVTESPETSDITASSQSGVQGQVSISDPDVKPEQGLIELPEEVVDATRRVAQICPREPGAKPLGEFTITGRGSLPPSPLEALPGTNNTTKLATLEGDSNRNISNVVPNKAQNTIIEAQGWVKNSDGSTELVAMAPQTTPSARATVPTCPQ